jgi:hypothetical protein
MAAVQRLTNLQHLELFDNFGNFDNFRQTPLDAHISLLESELRIPAHFLALTASGGLTALLVVDRMHQPLPQGAIQHMLPAGKTQ